MTPIEEWLIVATKDDLYGEKLYRTVQDEIYVKDWEHIIDRAPSLQEAYQKVQDLCLIQEIIYT